MDKMICIKNLKVHIISKIFAFLINMSHHLVCPPPLPHLKTIQQTRTNRIKNNHKSCNRLVKKYLNAHKILKNTLIVNLLKF